MNTVRIYSKFHRTVDFSIFKPFKSIYFNENPFLNYYICSKEDWKEK